MLNYARFALGVCVFVLLSCAPAPTPAPVPPLPPPSPALRATQPIPVPPSGFIEATPAAPLRTQGVFVYAAGDGSLWQQYAQQSAPSPLVERSVQAIAQMPSYSPDGKRIVYSALLFLADGNTRGDIRAVDADGKNPRTLIQAENNDVVYFYPRYARDGRLLVTRAENLQTTSEHTLLEWVNTGGARTRVVENARDADISPDGARIAFVRYNADLIHSALWLANADGTQASEWVGDQTFDAIMNPRFSPDGKWLAFAVHGAPRQNLPSASARSDFRSVGSEDDSCFRVWFFPCFVQTASAHMAPGALWRVNLETKKFQPLTDIYDDSPVPAWSRDSSRIAIHDYTGIRLIDLQRREIYPLFLEDGGNGGFDWFAPSPP